MPNGEMLTALKQYTAQGKEIPMELYKSLTLASHVDLNQNLTDLVEKVDCLEKSGSVLAHDNKDEIDRLRNRGNISDTLTAIAVFVAGILGMSK